MFLVLVNLSDHCVVCHFQCALWFMWLGLKNSFCFSNWVSTNRTNTIYSQDNLARASWGEISQNTEYNYKSEPPPPHGLFGCTSCINDPVESVWLSRWAGKKERKIRVCPSLEVKHMLLMTVSKEDDEMLKSLWLMGSPESSLRASMKTRSRVSAAVHVWSLALGLVWSDAHDCCVLRVKLRLCATQQDCVSAADEFSYWCFAA